uniref:Uncharacterized protein n=1 Tax=viral metagenome TaxID=1070528 RepID=A0A6C0ESA4_9ZZZZ
MTTLLQYNDTINCEKNNLTDNYFSIKNTDVNPTANINSINTLQTLAIADTFHDLAKPRNGYDEKRFENKVVNYLLCNQNVELDNDKYKQMKVYTKFLFGEEMSIDTKYEPKVTQIFEKKYNLQPASVSITYDDVLKGGKDVLDKITLSNGSINLIVPSNFSCFDEYASSFSDSLREKNFKIISDFIKKFLYSEKLGDVTTELQGESNKVHFLFDAGTNMIGTIFQVKGSGGIRFNAMACSADSASTSDGLLDPDFPNEYEDDREVNISSNYFTCDKIKCVFKVNDGRKFGEDGISCFSVNFTGKEKAAITENEFNSTASYYFGQMKDTQALTDYNGPCGTAGAGVPYIGQIFKALDDCQTLLERGTQNISAELNKFKSENSRGRIPIADARILNLFNKPYTSEDMLLLNKFVVDYKRTGDYEQILTILRKINKTGSNVGNYTFATVDLLASLFARMHKIPAILQIPGTGRIVLYRSDYFKGSAEDQENYLYDQKVKKLDTFKLEMKPRIALITRFLNTKYDNLIQLRDDLQNILLPKIAANDYISQINIFSIIYKLNVVVRLINESFNDMKSQISQNGGEDNEDISETKSKKRSFIEDDEGPHYWSDPDNLSTKKPKFTSPGDMYFDKKDSSPEIISNIHKLYNTIVDESNINELLELSNYLLENSILKAIVYLEENIPNLLSDTLIPINVSNNSFVVYPLNLVVTKNIVNDQQSKALNADISNLKNSIRNISPTARLSAIHKYIEAANTYYSKCIQSINKFISQVIHIENVYDIDGLMDENGLPISINQANKDLVISNLESELQKVIESIKKVTGTLSQKIPNIKEVIENVTTAFSAVSTNLLIMQPPEDDTKMKTGGGSKQDNNKRQIYYTVQTILLHIFDKSNTFMRGLVPEVDIIPNEKYVINNDTDFLKLLKTISSSYRLSIDEFIRNLYNDTMYELEELAGTFTLSDIVSGENDDVKLDLQTMLKECKLSSINFILYLLSYTLNPEENVYTYKFFDISPTDEANQIPMQNLPELKAIYYSELDKGSDILREAISLSLFGLLEYFYYYTQSNTNNMKTFINYSLTDNDSPEVLKLLKSYQSSPEIYLKSNLYSHIRFITTRLANIIGINTSKFYISETGEARGVGQPKRIGTNGKTYKVAKQRKSSTKNKTIKMKN